MCIAYFEPGQQRYVESVVCFLTVEKHARDDDHTSNCPSEHNLSTKISPTEVIKKKKKKGRIHIGVGSKNRTHGNAQA